MRSASQALTRTVAPPSSKEEALQQERNAASKSIGEMMREGKKDEAETAKERVRAINEELDEVSAKREAIDAELHDLMLHVPNIPCAATPVGKDETENPERRRWGTPRDFAAEGFEPKPHWDLGTDLDILDFERGNKISGSRFTVLGGAGARLERALINYFLDTHTSRGFKEWWPPVVVKRETMVGTGQLPKFEDDAYHVSGDMFLIPTAEVTLTNLHAGEVLDADTLPRWYTAFTPCFREEAGSAGRDTRGIIRQHEFDKVEMVKFATPEDSDNQLESMTAEAEYLLPAARPVRTVSSRCARATWASPRVRPTTSRCGCPATTATRKSPAARTAATSRRAAPTSSIATRRTSRARATCTRSTAPVCPRAAPWPPSWRTTSRPTAPSRSLTCLFPTWAPTSSSQWNNERGFS